MQPVFLYLLKMLICSGMLVGYYWVALRNARFHQWNRFYLLFGMLLSVLIPLVDIPLVAEKQPEVVVDMVGKLPWNVVVTAGEKPALSWEELAWMFTGLITLALLFTMVRSVIKVVKLYKSHERQQLSEVSLVITKEESAPFSFFKWLFWRQDIDPNSENGQRMLQHELAHIKQLHSADKLFTELLMVVFWINPFFWIMRRELYAIHEFLADDKAIARYDGAAFAAMILQAAHPGQPATLTNPFFSSQLKRRLIMITTSHQPKYSYTRRISGLVLMVAVATAMIFSIEKAHAQQPAPPPPPPAPKVEPLPDSIVSISISGTDKKATAQYKMKDGRLLTMKVDEAKKKGYPVPVPPPPPPAPREVTPPAGLAPVAPDGTPAPPQPPVVIKLRSGDSTKKPLYVVDGVIVKDIEKLSPNSISVINVLKDASATNKYGEAGKNGVIEITKKDDALAPIVVEGKPAASSGLQKVVSDGRSDYNVVSDGNRQVKEVTVVGYRTPQKADPLIFIDGKESTNEVLNALDPATIESINVLKSENAIDTYGDKGKNGVILVKTKKLQIISKADVPSFPGGQPGWRSYLSTSLRYPEKAIDKGTQGVVNLQFVVDKEGNISNVSTLNDPGDGLKDEAVRIIKKSPKWIPAEKDGEKVTARVDLPITFRLQ